MNKPAAIYARVSSDRQKENHTIASQTAALIEYAQKNGYSVPPEWVFQDEGYSGAILVRPGLEALRDLAAEGQIAAVLVYSPDRLSRKYAYQILLSEELSRCGVELVFLKAPAGATPEDQLLVQFQGMIAGFRHEPAAAVGNDPRFGACCAIQPIGEPHAMAKPNSGPGNASRARSVSGKHCPVATLADMSG